jgi:molybdopterin-binding protein
MNKYGVGDAAIVLGVSTDTVRRWVDAGRIKATRTPGGRRQIDGVALARFAQSFNSVSDSGQLGRESARNRFAGIVTNIIKDKVMAQVEIQSGPFRIVALISREAVDDLGLAPGVMVDAVVKSTNVHVELSDR